MKEPLLKVSSLVRHFGDVRAVDGISFELYRGQSVGLIGANGAGKTTLMRLLSTLDLPDRGEMAFDGVDLILYPEKVRSRIGWMPDGFSPMPYTSVRDFIDFYARAYGMKGSQRVQEVDRVMDFCGISSLADRMVDKLSKGQTQRIVLGRMLIGNPDFLIMDEPAAGLDPQARLEFKQLVGELKKEGRTMLISSHILSELAEMCDTMIFMDQGRIIRQGSQKELMDLPGGRIVYAIRPVGNADGLLDWLARREGWEKGVFAEDEGMVCATCLLEDEEAVARELRQMSADCLISEFRTRGPNLEETFVNILQQKP